MLTDIASLFMQYVIGLLQVDHNKPTKYSGGLGRHKVVKNGASASK